MQSVRDDGGCVGRRRFAIILFYGFVFWACYIAYALHMDIFGNDFGIFHRAATEPLETVYLPRAINPFAYPPTTLLWLKPWALLGEDTGFVVWIALSIGLVGWASARLAGPRVVLLSIISPALATSVAVGQFGALVGAMILLAVSLTGWRQGLLLGLAATIKPQILLAAPLILLARRDWEALAGAIAGGVAVVIAELASLGWGLWFDWLHALKEFPKAVARANAYAGSVSPAGVASYFHLPALPFLALGIAAGALLLRKRARAAGPVELAGLVIIASALMSPYLLVYDTAAVMPFVIQRMLADDGRGRLPVLAAFINPFAGIGLLWLAGALIAPLCQAKRKPEMAVSITSSL